ncbi:MAG: diguanylate cyclase [Planctomycetota bacterium]|nr:diguanylate cyclase [Planctomycetota bacterium]
MYREQFEELKHTGELPSPSGVGLRILVLTQQEDCSLDDIVHTIQADPALTGRIIKLATSAQYSTSVPLSTVKEAAVRLGLRTVAHVALGFCLVDGNRSGRCESFSYDDFWSLSLANAVAADAISREFDIGVPAEAFTCALLCRIGQLALASVHPTEYAEVLRQANRRDSAPLDELERDRFLIDHREIAQAMLRDWGLPECFAQAVWAFGRNDESEGLEDAQAFELLKILNASSPIAQLCLSAEASQHERWPHLNKVRQDLEAPAADFERICDEIAGSWQEWGEFLRVPTGYVHPLGVLRERAEELEDEEASAIERDPAMLRILAVDDDAVSLKLLSKHLERAGHYVQTASNGKHALTLALEMNPQIVVTDWMMPEMDGLQFCQALRRFNAGRNMYVLLLTGRGEEDRVVEAFEAGVDDYIVKPFKPKLLLARIRAGRRIVELQDQVEKDQKLQREQVAKLAVLNRKLRSAALTDPLTELPNRRFAMKRLEMEWHNSSRSGQPMSVIMIDIDHFKRVNDTHGHAVGDLVLKETARAIQRTLRRSDTCARMGGEEFLIICPNTDMGGAVMLAERIRKEVGANVVAEQAFTTNVTISLGVAIRTPFVTGIDHLIQLSDEAVYEAKGQGRDCVVEAKHPRDETRSA